MPMESLQPHSYASFRFNSQPLATRSLMMVDDLVCQCVATVSGHDAGVSSVVSAGDFLYTASLSNDIRMWELPDLAPCDQFSAHGIDHMCSVKAILVHKDRIFGAHQDHKIRVWKRDAAPSTNEKLTHKLIATLPKLKDCLWKSLSQTNYVQVRRHHKKLWIEHSDTISALALGKMQEVMYSASWDKTVKVWRMADLKCLESICAHDDAVNALVVCNRSGILYTGSADGKVKVWRKGLDAKKKHALLAMLMGAHEKGASVNALALSESGEFLFSAGSDGMVAVWGRRKGEEHMSKLLHKLAGCHAQPILCLSTCKLQEEGLLLSGSADKTVKVWQIDARADGCIVCVGLLQGHLGAVKSICVARSSDELMMVGGGCLVYTGSADKSVKAWWVSNGAAMAVDAQSTD